MLRDVSIAIYTYVYTERDSMYNITTTLNNNGAMTARYVNDNENEICTRRESDCFSKRV